MLERHLMASIRFMVKAMSSKLCSVTCISWSKYLTVAALATQTRLESVAKISADTDCVVFWFSSDMSKNLKIKSR